MGGVEAIDSDARLADAKARLEALRHEEPDLADKVQIITDSGALAKLRVPWAKAAVYQPNAAKCWPYKLVAWVLETLLRESGDAFNLQTLTPATQLQRVDDSWIVHTPRGQVAARTVVLATNAYTSHLLPKTTGLIVPVRGQVCALKPPAGSVPLGHSYVWEPEGSDDYLIQRDDDDAYLILGGERLSTPDAGVGTSRDDVVDEHVGQRLRRALHHAVDLASAPALPAAHEWTGIMGYSRDGHPWVGGVPSRLGGDDGLWISAAYTGHGMPVAARCGVAVAEMVLGREGGVELPGEYVVTEDRVDEARLLDMGRAMGTKTGEWERLA